MAATSISMTTFNAKLKIWYMDKKNLYTMDKYVNPYLQAVKKNTGAGGEKWQVAVSAGAVVGGAGTYSNARSNASAGKDVKFYGDYKDRFHMAFIDDKVIRASRKAEHAIVPALETKLNSIRDQFNQATNFQMYREEGGSVASVSSYTVAGAGNDPVVFTANSQKCGTQYLRPDNILRVGPNLDGSSLRTGTWTVQGVTSTGVTVTGSAGATAIQTSDYVFIDGDAGTALAGNQSWVPLTDTLAEASFKNATRSTDIRSLAGIRLDASGLQVNEAFVQAGDEANRFGAKTTTIFTHPSKLSALKLEFMGQVQYQEMKGRPMVSGLSAAQAAKFGFRALALDGSNGPILVVPDWACPFNVSWGLELDSIELATLGAWPSVKDEDGLTMVRQDSDNNYISELVGYGELLMYAPGHQVAIIHDAAR